jgi:Apea-like HEPN
VRKYGIFTLGMPRRDLQYTPYTLTAPEQPAFLRYLTAAMHFRANLEDVSSSLRRATALAGEYYETHHERPRREDQLIALTMALEGLFSPGWEGELRFRMAQSMALLLGRTVQDRQAIFQLVRKIYDERSKLVHGGGNPFGDGTLTAEDLAGFGDAIRRAVLSMITLYLRGERNREDVLRKLAEAALDQVMLDDLDHKTDIEAFMLETGFP